MSATAINQRYTWLICFAQQPFQWDIKLSFWVFNLLFVHTETFKVPVEKSSAWFLFQNCILDLLRITWTCLRLGAHGLPWVTVMITGMRQHRWLFVKVFYWHLDMQNLIPWQRQIGWLILFRFSMHAIYIRSLQKKITKLLQFTFSAFGSFL